MNTAKPPARSLPPRVVLPSISSLLTGADQSEDQDQAGLTPAQSIVSQTFFLPDLITTSPPANGCTPTVIRPYTTTTTSTVHKAYAASTLTPAMLSKKRSVPSHSYDYSCYTELAVLPTSLCQSPGSCSNSCGGNVALAKRNKRHKTTMAQLAMLEERYMMDKTPSQIDRFQLAKSLGMSPRQVQVWFQNRRAKERRDHETQEFERSLSEENTLAAAAQRQHRVSDVKMFADGAASQNNCNGRAPGCANNSDIEFKGILGISGKFNCTVDYPLPMPTPLGK